MRLVPKYRVSYRGEFYEAGHPFTIDESDLDEMKIHGTILEDSEPPLTEHRRPGRPRRVDNGQSVKTETANRRTGRSNSV